MSRLSSLLERFRSLLVKQAAIAVELTDVEREILAIEQATPTALTPPPELKTPKMPKSRSKAEGRLAPVTREMAVATLTAIRDVGGGAAVPRRAISRQLGIGDYACAYRLRRLVTMGFVERVDGMLYRVAKEVPIEL